jgi:2-polyprenyl-6-methoxyphenol hydroxylase-like FAD-dependent oxidoreductase
MPGTGGYCHEQSVDGGAVGAETFDVIVCGGGLSGSLTAGVLARGGLNVLVVEKEIRFRDRIRGEATHPWGVVEARRLGVESLFDEVDGVQLIGMRLYEGGALTEVDPWASKSEHGLGAMAFSHTRMQDAALAWARRQGAEVRRPAKLVGCWMRNGMVTVSVQGAGDKQLRARLVVGADGKTSAARGWTGGDSRSDPEHHRFGGVQVTGVQTEDRDTSNVAGPVGAWGNWFSQGPDTWRLYLCATKRRLRECGADRSFVAAAAFLAELMPEAALADVRQAGPLGFFANSDTWATRISGNHVTLVGDAAGSADPTFGHGTSLVFRDVRELTDLLQAGDDWTVATDEYAARRARYFEVIRQNDLWCTVLEMDTSSAGDRAREGNKAARATDPTLGGFAVLAAQGPDGLLSDEAARSAFFGGQLTGTTGETLHHLAPTS